MGYYITDPDERARRRTDTFVSRRHLNIYNFLKGKGICLLRGKLDAMVYEYLLSEFGLGNNPGETTIRKFVINTCISCHQRTGQAEIKRGQIRTVNHKVPKRSPGD
jgi:hypothetical protein